VISTDHLTKRYDGRVAVDGVTFTVEPGRVTGFLGPNGAGKSTTMRMILGLDRPTSGTATINGRRYHDLPAPLRTVGALLDAKAVDPGRTAEHHLLWLARTNRIPPSRVAAVLELVGLAGDAHRRIATYSLGMSQRLGIAAALLGDPDTVVLDEPINGLDPDGIIWLRAFLKGLAAEGRTVFLSSHLMSEMAQTADHLVVIGQGRILADASLGDIVRQHAQPTVRVRASSRQDQFAHQLAERGASVKATADGGLHVTGLDATTIGAIAAFDAVPLAELTPDGSSLEHAFLELTHDHTDHAAGPARPLEGATR
jgi:ABC-2 type transport system ATP-binding protein